MDKNSNNSRMLFANDPIGVHGKYKVLVCVVFQIIVDTLRVEMQTEDTRWTHEQLAEFPDGAFGSDGVYHTCEQWDEYKRSFKRDEVDVQNNDDEEVHWLIESEA